MSDQELNMQEDDNLVNEEEVTLDSASVEETEEVIDEANKENISMIFTGMRHFRH